MTGSFNTKKKLHYDIIIERFFLVFEIKPIR